MSNEWLAVQSFQRSQELLAAVNALSIHIKLNAAGASDEVRRRQAEDARAKLREFVVTMQNVIGDAQGEDAKPLLGANPRLRQLAKSLMTARRNRHRFRSALFRETLTRAEELIGSHKREDEQALLLCLDELRVLLSEHIHKDAEKVLGEF